MKAIIQRLGEATQAYQTYLEGIRAHPEDPELYLDFEKARREMEVAWLEAQVA